MKRNNAGSSLVEIVVATAIMGMLVGAVCTSLALGLRLNEKTDAQLKAQLAVSSVVETLMAEGIDPEQIDEENLYANFPDVLVTAEQVKEGEGDTATSLPFFKVTVTSEVEDVTITPHIREKKAVTES